MNKFIKFLFYSLLFFLPLAFAGTEVWAFFIFQLVITCLFIYYLVTTKQFVLSVNSKIIIYGFCALIAIAIIQSFNQSTVLNASNVIPFSLCSFYTLKEAVYFETLLLLFVVATQLNLSFHNIKQNMFVVLCACVTIMILGLLYQKGEYIKFFLGLNFSGSFGCFVNRNSAGAYLLLAFFMSMAYMLYNLYKYKTQELLKQTDYIIKISIQILIVLFFLVCIILVRSRGIYLATGISLFSLSYLLTIFVVNDKKLKVKCFSITTILLLLSLCLVYTNIDAINRFCYRQTLGPSELTRVSLYIAALKMLKDYWLFGVGFASFPVAINLFMNTRLDAWPQYLHNDWLELFLDSGIIVTTFIVVLLIILCVNIFKRFYLLSTRKKLYFITLACCLFGFCVASAVDFHFHIPADAHLFFIILSIVCSVVFYDKVVKININNIIKSILVVLVIVPLAFSAKQAIAWKYMSFSKYMMLDTKLEYLEKSVSLSKEPRYLQKLIVTYYNYSIDKNVPIENQIDYSTKANKLSQKYLELYPFDQKISLIYETSNKS